MSFSEILQFLHPSTPNHILSTALQLLLELEENYFKNLSNNEIYLFFQKITQFFSSSPTISSSNLILLLSILINLTAIQTSQFSPLLINSKQIILKLTKFLEEEKEGEYSTLTAQLFVNISRQFPQQFVDKLNCYDDGFGSKLIGFLVVNLSTVKSFAVLIATNKLDSFSSLLSFGETSLVKSSALQVIYNLSLQDESHALMLSKDLQANKLLVALLSPLVDREDKLSEEEIENLPVDLQYWEKKRNWDLKLWELTLCTFCATRLGRSFFRNANIYPLLREMDNARILKQGEDNLKNGIILEENGKNLDILRALISILIRREDEMGIEEVEDKLESIRELGI
uniref:Protein HGH1 homolog n=1 Tax=Meloidogyne floridensis TaxID=298350 RepID=A0A915NHY1_9BILA